MPIDNGFNGIDLRATVLDLEKRIIRIEQSLYAVPEPTPEVTDAKGSESGQEGQV